MNYSFNLAGCAPYEYPTEILFAILHGIEGDIVSIPKESPFGSEWGQSNSISCPLNDEWSKPIKIDMVWLSIKERRFYSIEKHINYENLSHLIYGSLEKTIIIGMAPYGNVAIWVYDRKKSYLIDWIESEQIDLTMEDFLEDSNIIEVDEYCDIVLGTIKRKNGLPPRNLFDKYMQQFTYRYQPLFEKWDDGEEVKWQKYKEVELQPEFEYIEESLFDGTFDKLHDDGLLKYHNAGKPKKLAINWHIKKSEYTAYFWFEDEKICSIFERFYGTHPETKTDFIIRIDAENRKYELALFRQGLKEPQIIPEETYQLIVFKNKFEDYRSENYNQERGAWIW